MSIKTKFGTANLRYDGYLQITSVKEGNFGKLLHRLLFEDFYQIQLPTNIDIHHADGNKTNNEIWNLIPMTRSEHMKIHMNTENNPNIGVSRSLSTLLCMSGVKNTTGFFRVTKRPAKTCKQGFIYTYQNRADGKKFVTESTDINKLKEKVVKKGLEWHIIDKTLAEKTIKESENYKQSQLKLHPTGVKGVYISKEKRAKKGFEYRFDYQNEEGKMKRISSVNINKLKDKMIRMGFDWIVLDEQKAMECGLL